MNDLFNKKGGNMKRLLALGVCLIMLTGCATAYNGFTDLRIKAQKFNAAWGLMNKFSGEGVDAHFTRQMTLTGDKDRKFVDNPSIKQSTQGNDSTREILQK